jgi:hypothetical protein
LGTSRCAYTLDAAPVPAGTGFLCFSWLQPLAWSWFIGLILLFLVVLGPSPASAGRGGADTAAVAAGVVMTPLSQPEHASPSSPLVAVSKVEYIFNPQHIFVNG